MTKKDVLEIRHLFAPKECSISKIRGCYVDGDCNKVATINEQFLTMPEEETYKYFEILKKTLSGRILSPCHFLPHRSLKAAHRNS